MTDEKKLTSNYSMVEPSSSADENEIDLLELIHTLLKGWKTIIGTTFLCTGLAIYYAITTQEIFKAETFVVPVDREQVSGFSSALGNFEGLASVAGFNIPSDSNLNKAIATLESRKFLNEFINRKNLLPVFFEEIWDKEDEVWIVETEDDQPSEQKAVDAFRGILSVDEDKHGLINLSISWKNPVVAAEWANDLVNQLNKKLREKAIIDSQKRVGYLEQELAKTTLQDMREVLYKLLESEKQKAMLANVSVDFALEVIDPAVAPETRVKPQRKLIVALGGVCGGFLGIFAVFFAQFLQKLKCSSEKVHS